MAKIVYGQMPAPRELPQQIPAPPRAKAWMQKPQGGGKFLVQIPGVRGGGMVMAKIDSCIIGLIKEQHKKYPDWEKLFDSHWLRHCEFICNLRANSAILGKLQISRPKSVIRFECTYKRRINN